MDTAHTLLKIRVSRPLWMFFRICCFFYGSELTSITVDDKGIVQFDHKLLHHFFQFKSAIFNA